ncbi:MAG: FGGY-family carbohydrate kinase [Lawsonibacter sp.]
MKKYLGVELGSTRIKGVVIDESFVPVESGDFEWESTYDHGIWTYDLADAREGLCQVLSQLKDREGLAAAGISGMMHGYLAFDKDWNLLVPFRTWQNTITADAAEQLTELFQFNVPQRWSIAHLYQAILNGEAHVSQIAHITTLSSYVHYMLTGENVVGVGEASGMFPIDSATGNWNEEMLKKFEALTQDQPWNIRDVLPRVLLAGQDAGRLTAEGSAWVKGLLPEGLPFAPPEGDAGTGMVATNAVAPRTGNVSAGTSIFAMVVLEKPLSKVYTEIDVVTTPSGKDVAMVHCNNCTSDINAWIGLLRETLGLFGCNVSAGEVFTKLYQKSLEGEADCGGVLVYNYMAGEGITHLDAGRSLVVRKPDSHFSLANFMRSSVYAEIATMRLGMDILAEEQVKIDSMTGHGGIFKTPGVAQRYLAAACNASITCMETAGEGGPYGIALLAAFMDEHQLPLEEFLRQRVFVHAKITTAQPDPAEVEGFARYLAAYDKGLDVERHRGGKNLTGRDHLGKQEISHRPLRKGHALLSELGGEAQVRPGLRL